MTMNYEEKIDYLLHTFTQENQSYQALAEPVNTVEKRRLLRSLMNTRIPGKPADEVLEIQDDLLQEEQAQKQITDAKTLPAIEDKYPCADIKNADRISLWQGDITAVAADAIVNAANAQLLGCFVPCHGCIDNAIHSAAGVQLRNECAEIMEQQGHDEPVGKAKITKGYNLPARYVIHTVGPIVGMQVTEEQKHQLVSCYQSCLKLAEKSGLSSIAFCCISTGEFHFPNKLAAEIAVRTIDRYLSASKLRQVVINVYKTEDLHIYEKLFR